MISFFSVFFIIIFIITILIDFLQFNYYIDFMTAGRVDVSVPILRTHTIVVVRGTQR